MREELLSTRSEVAALRREQNRLDEQLAIASRHEAGKLVAEARLEALTAKLDDTNRDLDFITKVSHPIPPFANVSLTLFLSLSLKLSNQQQIKIHALNDQVRSPINWFNNQSSNDVS